MDKYERVETLMAAEAKKENEIRVNSRGHFHDFIDHATYLLQEIRKEEIEFKAMGQAISKAVATVEMVKKRYPMLHQDIALSTKRYPMLHQDIALSTVSLTDIWDPTEVGLLPVEIIRQVSMITITLSTEALNKNSPGYQAPSGKKPKQANRQPRETPRPYNAVNKEESYGRGSGRDGRTGRGSGYQRNQFYSPSRGGAPRVYGRIRAPVPGQ